MPHASTARRSFGSFFREAQDLDTDVDYTLIADLGGGYAARARDGAATLVIPLPDIQRGAAGRRASGCELLGHSTIRVNHRGHAWECAAAALICRDPNLLEAFGVLADDVLRKTTSLATWATIAAAVDEWLALLTPKGAPNAENEMGLWGELWFLSRSLDIERMLSAWRGPDRDNVDFFVESIAIEVKTSKARHRHFVSQAQVGAPVGDLPAWLLSIWVKVQGGAGPTVPVLVDSVLERVENRGEGLRRIIRAGYSAADRASYTTSFIVLEEPCWFAARDVPRVRVADRGVSRLRYHVELDQSLRADETEAARLWLHCHQQSYESET